MSNYNIDFQVARRGTGCDWISWIGSPLFYDAPYFVERDEPTPQLENRAKRALVDMGFATNTRIMNDDGLVVGS